MSKKTPTVLLTSGSAASPIKLFHVKISQFEFLQAVVAHSTHVYQNNQTITNKKNDTLSLYVRCQVRHSTSFFSSSRKNSGEPSNRHRLELTAVCLKSQRKRRAILPPYRECCTARVRMDEAIDMNIGNS